MFFLQGINRIKFPEDPLQNQFICSPPPSSAAREFWEALFPCTAKAPVHKEILILQHCSHGVLSKSACCRSDPVWPMSYRIKGTFLTRELLLNLLCSLFWQKCLCYWLCPWLEHTLKMTWLIPQHTGEKRVRTHTACPAQPLLNKWGNLIVWTIYLTVMPHLYHAK